MGDELQRLIAAEASQRAVCARIGARWEAVRPGLKVGVSRRLSAASGPIHGLRHPATETTNGWYIWPGELDSSPDFFVPLHVEHLASVCPLVLPYLALAPGHRFLIDHEGHEDVWFDPNLLHV